MKLGFVFKLNMGLASILFLVALSTGLFFSAREASQVEEFLEKKIIVIAGLAAKGVEAGLAFENKDDVKESLKHFSRIEGIYYLYVLDSGGDEFASFTASGFTGNEPELKSVQKEEEFIDGDTMVANYPIISDGVQIGTITVGLGMEEVDHARKEARNVTFGLGAIILILGCSIFLFFLRRMMRPIRGMVVRLKDIAQGEGDLTKRLDVSSGDELGEMAKWFNEFADKLQSSLRSIGAQAQSVAYASRELNNISSDLETTVTATSDQSQRVSDGSEVVQEHVQSAATGVSQMESSIAEISRVVHEVTKVARSAVEEAEKTTGTVVELEDSSARIDNVLKVISSIAEQTNLLALNATIEAARAGEAGKGFAVVANEVKELAKETAKATDDVRKLVESIATSSHAAVDAIAEISTIITKIDELQTTIAAAVEEQSATAGQVRVTIENANSVTGKIAESIHEVAETAQGNAEFSAKLLGSAATMSQTAEQLTEIVDEFQY